MYVQFNVFVHPNSNNRLWIWNHADSNHSIVSHLLQIETLFIVA
jgi:hypothetical protein